MKMSINSALIRKLEYAIECVEQADSGRASATLREIRMELIEGVEEDKRLREKNRSLFLQLSEAQGQLNAIHRGEEE
tara:strand:+ start:10235 stop:10465 length:231 start_codon:yes stop_codon:yes gene_type:complete